MHFRVAHKTIIGVVLGLKEYIRDRLDLDDYNLNIEMVKGEIKIKTSLNKDQKDKEIIEK